MDAADTQASGTPAAPMRRHALWRLFDLRQDQADPDLIDAAVRDNARLAGTNLWVLMFAIVIASVGLNVNSTAVIIGAMLISPLMGPIIGIGYGVGVHDHALIRKSFGNLAVFVGISLLASTAYFALSPLTQAHSEILARTAPSIWDVLIAFFGGAAGMVGLTRKEKTTLIPGVAIATALMPPLCTAGYGLATGQPRFFLGAFYLFLINGVFIALASLAVVRLLRLPRRAFTDDAARRRDRLLIAVAVTATLVPSVVLAYRLVQDELFAAGAERFVQQLDQASGHVTLLSREIEPRERRLTLTVMGKGVTSQWQRDLEGRLAAFGLADATLKIRHPNEETLDIGSLQRDLQRNVLRSTMAAIDTQTQRIAELERQLAAKSAAADEYANAEAEIHALLPGLRKVVVAPRAPAAAGGDAKPLVLVAAEPARRLTKAEVEQLKRWMKARWPAADVRLTVGPMS
jgi:uncharacterized hydrophobic protein (TIGR00271 family)